MKRWVVLAIAVVLVISGATPAFAARPTYTNKAAPSITSVSLVPLGNDYYHVDVSWDVYAGKPIGVYVYGHPVSGGNLTWSYQRLTRAELLAGETTYTHPDSTTGLYIPSGDFDILSVCLVGRKTEDWMPITPVP